MSSLARNKPISAIDPGLTRSYEFWFVTVALLLTAVLPGISKYQSADDSGSTPANEILWSLMYLVAVVRLYMIRSTAKTLFRKSLPLWVFLALIFLTTFWSLEPMITFKNAIELIGTTLVGVYIVTRFTLPQFMVIFSAAFTVIGFLSMGLIFGAPAHGRMDWGGGAWSGLYQEKNNLAGAAALVVITQVLFITRSRGRGRKVAMGALFLSSILLIGAQSATALVTTLIVLLVPLLIAAWRSTRFGIVPRIVMIVGAVIGAITFWISGMSTDSLLALIGRQSNLTGRADFWPYLQQAISDNPVLGYGYNAFFRSAVGKDYLASYVIQAGGWSPYHAHNSFYQITLDAGYVGLAALIALLAVALWHAILYIRREPTSIAVWPLAIVLHLILGSFTETYLARCNTMEWILFTAAFLYPLRAVVAERQKVAPTSVVTTRDVMRARILARREARIAAGSASFSRADT